ncbi:hypothetical protein [Pinibacter aurantiacus]|uniref:J domain-containing protein n=1 Tax=Pinibacter aurantiacus TaxID=2851599 RepID=A0A9E2S809_9BACT|nr:hypothetical protein [Pinibacter aurantiacus]MBV4357951.1 hypothetical protein [Pinibacter aurantiacus]
MQKSLVIKGSQAQTSKAQQAFNGLIRKIERLQHAIQLNTQLLDEKLMYYNSEMLKQERELLEAKKEIVKELYKAFISKTYKGRERTLLKSIITSHLEDIMEEGELEDELQQIFRGVKKMDYQEMKAKDFEMEKEKLEQIFSMYGFDVNTEAFKSAKSKDDLLKESFKMMEEFERKAEERKNEKKAGKKTKKQLARELNDQQKEELRGKNIGRVYKQLAKIFHPDLEPDPAKKTEKEELMKQLTIAYESKDLHTLLRLELEYIHKEENNTANLSEEKLKIYNEVLREQVAELESELHMLPMHPQYSALHAFVDLSQNIASLNLVHEKLLRDSMLRKMKKAVEKLRGTTSEAAEQIQKLLKQFEGREEVE